MDADYLGRAEHGRTVRPCSTGGSLPFPQASVIPIGPCLNTDFDVALKRVEGILRLGIPSPEQQKRTWAKSPIPEGCERGQ